MRSALDRKFPNGTETGGVDRVKWTEHSASIDSPLPRISMHSSSLAGYFAIPVGGNNDLWNGMFILNRPSCLSVCSSRTIFNVDRTRHEASAQSETDESLSLKAICQRLG